MAQLTARALQIALDRHMTQHHGRWTHVNPDATTSTEIPGIVGRYMEKKRLPDGTVGHVAVSAVGPNNPTGGIYTIGDLEYVAAHARSLNDAVKTMYAHITGSKPLSDDPSVDAEATNALVSELQRRLSDMEKRMALTNAVVENKANQVIDAAREIAEGRDAQIPTKLSDLGGREAMVVANEQYEAEAGRWTRTRAMTEAEKDEFRQAYGIEPQLTKTGALDKRQLRHLTAQRRIKAVIPVVQDAQ
jgi:hypothetical protein